MPDIHTHAQSRTPVVNAISAPIARAQHTCLSLGPLLTVSSPPPPSHLFLSISLLPPPTSQPSQKSFRIKKILAKKQRQNRPLPQWFRFRTDSNITYNAKRRNWRRTKLGL